MKVTAQTKHISAKGFTLIELLIVIAVLGILAAVVLVAINPLEQLARGRDSGRKSTLGQLASAMQAYYTAHSSTGYPTENNTWMNALVTSGDLKTPPAAVAYGAGTTACTGGGVMSDICYINFGNSEAVIYTRLESTLESQKCAAVSATNTVPWFLWSSSQSQSGVVCTADTATEPTGVAGYTFVQ